VLAVVENVAVLVGDVMVTPGAVVSGVKVIVNVSVLVLPAASRAVTTRVLVPDTSEIDAMLQFVVPDAAVLAPPFSVYVTCVTPTLSDAVPPIDIVLDEVENVDALVGDVMLTLGAVVSGPAAAEPDTSPDSRLFAPDAL
jgi:hypothetical protein